MITILITKKQIDKPFGAWPCRQKYPLMYGKLRRRDRVSNQDSSHCANEATP
jgi:hypothetical protein